jgi:antitoxin VapB
MGVEMNTAKIFENGRSQAVRLPKEFRFSDDVYIKKLDDLVLLIPKDKVWKIFRESFDDFSTDLELTREPDPIQERDEIE